MYKYCSRNSDNKMNSISYISLDYALRNCFSWVPVSLKHLQYTVDYQCCNQDTQQQTCKDITPVMLVITDTRQSAQEPQLSYQQLKKKLEKPAVWKIDHGFHVQYCEGHSICCNEKNQEKFWQQSLFVFFPLKRVLACTFVLWYPVTPLLLPPSPV